MTADALVPVLLLVVAVPATLFPVLYAFLPWYRTDVGWAVMIQAVGMMLMVWLGLARQFLGDDYPYRDVARMVVYLLLATALWAMLVALLRGYGPRLRAVFGRGRE